MELERASVEWAINFLAENGDGDIFPPLPELSALRERVNDFANSVTQCQIKDLHVMPPRRYIVPKDEWSYRQATQLHPQDSIVLTALIHQLGGKIENRRKPRNKVFSYRFAPNQDNLYEETSGWSEFWTAASLKAASVPLVLYCDIADFYNQIYHHCLENQLEQSGFPNQAIKWIISLLNQTTASVSRGVPIGPHAIHILAEATLVPIDNSLEDLGLDYLRYADDILVFCSDVKDAKHKHFLIAQTLDKQQRLMLQKHKLKLYQSKEFQNHCTSMLDDRPINEFEREIVELIEKKSNGNPYRLIARDRLSAEDWSAITEEKITVIVDQYLSAVDVDFVRLRWFFRRLTQVGHPGGLKVVLSRLDELGPCFSSICTYISSIREVDDNTWQHWGDQLITLLESELIMNSEFLRMSILSLFTRNPSLNHFAKLSKKYGNLDPASRREVILAASANKKVDWLRELKESFVSMDPWQRIAFIFSTSDFPTDEKKFFLKNIKSHGVFEENLIKWVKLSQNNI